MKNDELLRKWLNYEVNVEDLDRLKNDPDYTGFIAIAEAGSRLSPPDFDMENTYGTILSQLDSRIPDKMISNKRGLRSMKTFYRIAAVIAVLFASFYFFNSGGTSIHTGIADKQAIVLPDHSEVILNADSEIKYNKGHWKENRSLQLDGEALFSVIKGSEFSVKTALGAVKVLGTRFDVLSRENHFYVSCFEGIVSVSYSDTIAYVKAGNTLRIEDGVLVHFGDSDSINPAWISDESYFENATLAFVLEELERQYPVKIKRDNIDIEERFTGTFPHTDLNLALKSVCDPLNLAYTINENDVVTIYAKEIP